MDNSKTSQQAGLTFEQVVSLSNQSTSVAVSLNNSLFSMEIVTKIFGLVNAGIIPALFSTYKCFKDASLED